MSDDVLEMGPIDYLVMEFGEDRFTGESLPVLVDLVGRGVIRILDLTVVARDPDGTVVELPMAELAAVEGFDLGAFDGAGSGLIDRDDVEEVARILEPGRVAVVAVYENTWAAPLVGALRRQGAQVVAGGRIPADVLLDALEAAESVA